MVGFCCNEMVNHINSRGKEDLNIGIASGIGHAFGQEGFACTGIANENDIAVGRDIVEMKQLENTIF